MYRTTFFSQCDKSRINKELNTLRRNILLVDSLCWNNLMSYCERSGDTYLNSIYVTKKCFYWNKTNIKCLNNIASLSIQSIIGCISNSEFILFFLNKKTLCIINELSKLIQNKLYMNTTKSKSEGQDNNRNKDTLRSTTWTSISPEVKSRTLDGLGFSAQEATTAIMFPMLK